MKEHCLRSSTNRTVKAGASDSNSPPSLLEGEFSLSTAGTDTCHALGSRWPCPGWGDPFIPEDNASEHLRLAWRKVYGRDADPSGADREAVKAVEAAAKPVVLPDDDLATLGKMIARIEQAPHKFAVSLNPRNFAATDGLLGMMKLLWKGQQDRHGTDDPTAPIQVALEEAEAALHIAVTLVQWFRSGAVRVVQICDGIRSHALLHHPTA